MNPNQTDKRVSAGILMRTNPSGLVTYVARMTLNGRASSRTFSTLTEARAWRDASKADAAKDDAIARVVLRARADVSAGALTLAQLIVWYGAKYTVLHSIGNQQCEQARLSKLLRHPLADKRVADISADDILDVIKDVKEGQIPPPLENRGFFKARSGETKAIASSKPTSDTTAYRYFSLLSMMFKRGIADNYVPARNPCLEVGHHKLTAKTGLLPNWKSAHRERRLQDGESEALLAALAAGVHGESMIHLVMLAAEIPTRRDEWLSATWRDVFFTQEVLRRPRKRHDELVNIPMTSQALDILREMREKQNNPEPDALLFPDLTTSRLRYAWNAAAKRAGITDLVFHDLRHESTSALAELGLTIKELMAFTGHKTVDSILRYINARDNRDLARKVSRMKKASTQGG